MRWAPWSIPRERRIQTAVLFVWCLLMPMCLMAFAMFLFVPLLWPLTIVYLVFMVFDSAPVSGGRPLRIIRHNVIWRYFANYFPLSIKKEADLDPSKTYLFGYHPHGIIGLGAWGNFAADHLQFKRLYPGIDLRVCTLASNFRLPFFRDVVMGMGMVSADKESINHVLRKGPGNAVMIVVGGAAEALDARPGTNDLTLKSRKGFVKLALKNGACLVPVFSFGENDMYNQLLPNPRGSTLRKWQNRLKEVFGFSMPLFIGRGIFNYDFGLLPNRRPVVSVVGKPIPVPRIEDPDDETLDKYHQIYINELQALFDLYKETYAKDRKHDMRLVDDKEFQQQQRRARQQQEQADEAPQDHEEPLKGSGEQGDSEKTRASTDKDVVGHKAQSKASGAGQGGGSGKKKKRS